MANLNQNANNLRDTFADTRDILVEVQKALGKNRDTVKESASEYRKLESIAQKLLLDQENLVQLTDKQIQQERDKAQAAAQEIKRQAERLMAEKGIVQVTSQVLTFRRDLTEEQKELLAAAKDGFAVENEMLEAIEKELEIRSEVNRLLGVTGNILKGVNELLGPFAKAFNLDAVSARMTEVADELARSEEGGTRLQVAFAGVLEAGKQLGETLTDPAVVIGYIVRTFKDFEKSNKEVRQLTGQTAANYSSFNTSATSAVDQVKTIASLSKEIGINVNAAFSPDTVLAATELTELMGISAKSTANLAMNAEAFGKDLGNVDELAENTVKSFALQGKGALNMQQVLENAGGASQSLQLSFKGNNEELLKASANAAALGLTLQEVEKIADSLLNFETSIAAELEAELLTGKEINLDKARQAALNNDMATLTEEIANNQEILSAFSSGNRIQQEAIANSLGMSKDEVAKMIVLQKISSGLTAEQAAKAADISVEEAKRLSATDSINKSLEKMAAAFAPILDFVSKLVSSKAGMLAVQAIVLTLVGSKVIGGVGKLAKDVGSLAKGFRGISSAASAAGGAGGAGGAGARAGIGGFLKGLGDGLASIGKKAGQVIAGGLALAVVGVALGGAFALSLMMIQDVDSEKIIVFTGALVALGLTLALLGNIGANIILGALAMGILGAALIPAAFAFSLLENVPIENMIAFSIALPLLALAAAGLGFLAPFILAGSAALAALGLALIPMALGFSMLGEVNTEGVLNSLIQFASMAPALALVAASLFGIAGGLAAVSLAGFAALPVIGALTGLGLVAGAISPGGGSDEVVQELKEVKEILAQILNKDSNISIDSTRLGTAMSISSAKLQ